MRATTSRPAAAAQMRATTSRPAAAAQMRARVSPAVQPKVLLCQVPFLPQPSLFLGMGTGSECADLHTLRLDQNINYVTSYCLLWVLWWLYLLCHMYNILCTHVLSCLFHMLIDNVWMYRLWCYLLWFRVTRDYYYLCISRVELINLWWGCFFYFCCTLN